MTTARTSVFDAKRRSAGGETGMEMMDIVTASALEGMKVIEMVTRVDATVTVDASSQLSMWTGFVTNLRGDVPS